MSTQYRKLVKKLSPKTKKPDEKPPEKIGNDYWLLAVLLLTVFFLILSWAQFDNINRALYVALILSLGSTYLRRHVNLNETQENFVSLFGMISLIAAVALFVVKLYYSFIA
jgi:hypothetical protein